MKWLISVILLAVAFSSTKGQTLKCLSCGIDEVTCNDTKVEDCVQGIPKLVCTTAEVRVGGETRYEKTCTESDLCEDVSNLCPQATAGSKCLGGGCCNTTSCKPVITYLPVPTTPAPSSAVVAPDATTQAPAPVVPTSTMEAAKKSSTTTSSDVPAKPESTQKAMMESASPTMAEKPMSSAVVYSKAITQEILVENTTPTPTCSGMRYFVSPLVIMIVVLFGLF